MPNKDIFCNVPWYDLHIYWDGSFGICCAEDHKLYQKHDRHYNIATMSIAEWYNSEPVKKFRQGIHGDSQLSPCLGCYLEEQHSGHSKRRKENQKSVIFAQAFDDSYKQSPGRRHFEYNNSGHTDTMPIDLHIDLGNFCNLACKMCSREASTTIASQEVRWGMIESKQYLGVDWTQDSTTWNGFKQQLLEIQGLNNIHFMGGETLLTDRFEDLVDTMIEHEKFDLCFSFVTNGTVFKPALLDKLKKFKRVGIEVSIETTTAHNAYIRQGTDTAKVLANIANYLKWCNGSSITVTLRSAPSLLSIGYYHTLLQYALDKRLLIKSNLCYNPRFLYAVNLPIAVRRRYSAAYENFILKLDPIDASEDYNASDQNNYQQVIKQEAEMCRQLLAQPEPADIAQQLKAMVDHCRRWDHVYGYDARSLYPELADVWNAYRY